MVRRCQRLLCVGSVTVDVVNTVVDYPEEDSDVRALSHEIRVGGNAANTAIVLAQLGFHVDWVGNLPTPHELIEQTFSRYGVGTGLASAIADASPPTSYITLSKNTGSRSIVHYRDIPEYAAADFEALDLHAYDWVHFEGRAVDELARMVAHAQGFERPRISIEVEKPRPGIEDLLSQADLLLFSRDYAVARGFSSAEALLAAVPKRCLRTCTWGAQGAWAMSGDDQLIAAKPEPLAVVTDSIGAGDTFNAAMIAGICCGKAYADCLSQAVAAASQQCSVAGLTLPGVSN